ncbi:hsp20/alpha crystallin family protein, partial [Medicago truncatula]
MELELGLKITKTKDDIDSISEYKLMKDTGPIFQSRETNTMFILTAHLKGYKRISIDIKISKDGSKISISGEKPIQEMIMMGWVMQRKVVDIKGFNKVFKIPYGVNLDKIKGNYNEEEWILNIYMPNFVKGIFGLKFEEVKEQEFDKRISELDK